MTTRECPDCRDGWYVPSDSPREVCTTCDGRGEVEACAACGGWAARTLNGNRDEDCGCG